MGKAGEKQKRRPKIKDKKQSERFKEAARQIGADEGSETMGKAARNERLKLFATYCNNIGVGFAVAGFVIPYLAFLPKLMGGRSLDSDELVAALVVAGASIGLSGFAHLYGMRLLKGIED